MEVLTNSLRHFEANITLTDLQNELIDLAKSWDVVKLGRLDGFDYYHEDSDDEGSKSEDESQFTSPNHTDPCRKYPLYVYLLMTEYNMLTNAFQSVGLAYQIPVDSPCQAVCM